MKIKKEIFCIIMVMCLCCGTILGCFTNIAYDKIRDYKSSTRNLEKIYVKNSTTDNLVKLCDKYIRANDLKYLNYVDELLSAEDYEQAVSEYYKNDEEFLSYAYLYGNKDTHLISTMYICAVNNNIDKFIFAMEKYYPQMSAGTREICFNNTMLKIKTEFMKDNRDIIVNKMCTLNFETITPFHKILNLSNALAAYKANDENNPKIKEIEKEIETVYNEWNPTDKNAVIGIQEEQMKNYIYYWTYMMKYHNMGYSPNVYSYADSGMFIDESRKTDSII